MFIGRGARGSASARRAMFIGRGARGSALRQEGHVILARIMVYLCARSGVSFSCLRYIDDYLAVADSLLSAARHTFSCMTAAASFD
jgi:hypothetical protein